MDTDFELSFCELRCKEIINTVDGKRLGRIVDLVFDGCSGRIKGIVAPYQRRFFFKPQEIFIPWRCVCKIGEDTILVHLASDGAGREGNRSKGYFEVKHNDFAQPVSACAAPQGCEGKCDKCLNFDCGLRWKNDNFKHFKGKSSTETEGKGEQSYKDYYGGLQHEK